MSWVHDYSSEPCCLLNPLKHDRITFIFVCITKEVTKGNKKQTKLMGNIYFGRKTQDFRNPLIKTVVLLREKLLNMFLLTLAPKLYIHKLSIFYTWIYFTRNMQKKSSFGISLSKNPD